jgi:hypothetical protein
MYSMICYDYTIDKWLVKIGDEWYTLRATNYVAAKMEVESYLQSKEEQCTS